MTERIRIISIVIILVAIVMSIRLYFVQVVNGDTFTAHAERQNINENTISFNRGQIYFESKDGETIPAAISRSGFTISINPKILNNPEEVYDILSKIIVIDKDEFFSKVKETLSDYPQGDGNIITSIEPSAQLFLENELESTREKWGSNGAGGIIIDPVSGEIVAMAWDPSFDLNNFKEGDVGAFRNPLVEDRYEMGSIVKALTMAIGLDLGTVRASSTYYDAGYLFLNNKRISNYDGRGRGTVDMQEVLNQSLNTGAAYVAMKVGNEKFAEYMKNFSVGTETGIDLPNEGLGLISNLESKRDIEIVTSSYGQGIAFTPIATVRALSVLANGGTLITPHLVKKVEYQTGLSKKMSFAPGKQVIKQETSEEITRMLVEVVDTSLRGGTAKIPGYSVAAKTGTAQMTNEGEAGYVEGKYLHSFFGYFPSYEPKFLVFLFHTYPKDVRYASETLTDPFLNITKFLINYYQIPPDRPEDVINTL